MKRKTSNIMAELAKRVDIGLSDLPPIHKLDTEFEGCARLAHELGFVDPDRIIEIANMGQSRFADADRTDRIRFDQSHRQVWQLE